MATLSSHETTPRSTAPRVIWADLTSSDDEVLSQRELGSGAETMSVATSKPLENAGEVNSLYNTTGLCHDDAVPHADCPCIESCYGFAVQYEMCDVHDLVAFTAREASYRCKCCRTLVPTGAIMFGCQSCPYDVCSQCRGEQSVAGVRTRVTTVDSMIQLVEEEPCLSADASWDGEVEVQQSFDVSDEVSTPAVTFADAPAAAQHPLVLEDMDSDFEIVPVSVVAPEPAVATVAPPPPVRVWDDASDEDDDFTIQPVAVTEERVRPPTTYGHSWMHTLDKNKKKARGQNQSKDQSTTTINEDSKEAAAPKAKKTRRRRRGGRRQNGHHDAIDDEEEEEEAALVPVTAAVDAKPAPVVYQTRDPYAPVAFEPYAEDPPASAAVTYAAGPPPPLPAAAHDMAYGYYAPPATTYSPAYYPAY